MEHDEMNDDTSAPAGSAPEASTSAEPPEPPVQPPEPPAADAGPGLAGQVAAGHGAGRPDPRAEEGVAGDQRVVVHAELVVAGAAACSPKWAPT